MAYTPIKTNDLEDVKLSYTTKQTFDILNNNASELDDRADRADAKFEAIEPIVENAVTYIAQTGKTDAQKAQARTNIGAGTYSKPSGGIPASDLAESYYPASNPNGYTSNQGTVTSVGAGAGLSISGTASVNPTVNVASDRKLPTTTEWNTVNANISAAQTSADNAQTSADNAQTRADDAYALAEGRENAVSYANYQAMVAALNAESSATLKVGDNIYIETVGVPDLWVSDVLDSKASYTYTSDQAIVDALNNPSVGYINIGWYRLDELETAKVDLSGYVQKTTTVTGTGALGGGGALSQNRTITHNAGGAPNKAYGLYKISTDAYSHVSGATAVQTSDLTPLLDGSYLAKNSPTGIGSLSLNRKANTTIGHNSVAVGTNTTASGVSSFAAGSSSAATAENAVAIGNRASATNNSAIALGNGTASGIGSFAVGGGTTASGSQSTAMGSQTEAQGNSSQAQGNGTVTKSKSQFAFGEYNAGALEGYTSASDRGTYVEMVGNGTSSARSNARTLDWNGNEVLAGTSTATGFKTPSGTASQFLKADGSVDNTAYGTGTVKSVGAGTGLSISGTASTNPTVNIASGYKLPTTTEWNAKATQEYVDNAVGAIDTKKAFTFTANDARWSSSLVDGVYTLTMNASNTTGFVAGKIPFACFNGDNEQVMATLGFTSTTVYIKSDTKFAGTIYMI